MGRSGPTQRGGGDLEKRTRVCDIFGHDYPIIQGGMLGISSPELVAAVSNAGGLGLLSGEAKALRQQIRRTRELTPRPFGVNIPLTIAKTGGLEPVINLVVEEGVEVIATAAGNPVPWVQRLKDAGLKVMHVVPTARLAQRAEDAGADAVVASGFEAGGFLGHDQVTTMALVPLVVDSVSIPVIAAGGIADARGMVAAFALGAEGVQLGTRFVATRECSAPKRQVAAGALGQARLLKMDILGGEASPGARMRYSAGQIAGVVREIKSAREVVEEMVRDYDRIISSL